MGITRPDCLVFLRTALSLLQAFAFVAGLHRILKRPGDRVLSDCQNVIPACLQKISKRPKSRILKRSTACHSCLSKQDL